MRSSVAAILLALCLTAPAVGQETNEARVDTPPEWVNRPTREDLVAVFPGSPQAARGGRATVTCTVTVLGGLRACRVDGETPEGAGFGAAALSLTLQFTMRPATRGGRPVESQVRIPLTWPAMPMSDRRPGETRPMISHPHWARASGRTSA